MKIDTIKAYSFLESILCLTHKRGLNLKKGLFKVIVNLKRNVSVTSVFRDVALLLS